MLSKLSALIAVGEQWHLTLLRDDWRNIMLARRHHPSGWASSVASTRLTMLEVAKAGCRQRGHRSRWTSFCQHGSPDLVLFCSLLRWSVWPRFFTDGRILMFTDEGIDKREIGGSRCQWSHLHTEVAHVWQGILVYSVALRSSDVT